MPCLISMHQRLVLKRFGYKRSECRETVRSTVCFAAGEKKNPESGLASKENGKISGIWEPNGTLSCSTYLDMYNPATCKIKASVQ